MPQTKERRTNTKINVSSSNSSIVSVCSLTSRDSQTSIKSFFSVSSCRTNLRRPKKSTLLNQQTIDKDDTTGNHNEIIAAVSDKNKQGANTGNNALSFQDRRQPCKIKEELRVSVKLDTQKRIKTYEQLYIDLGQRNFAAQIICPICGMLTVHGLEADIQRHKAVCQAHTQGVSFPHALFRGTLPLLRVHSTFALPYYNPPTGKIMVTEVSTKSRKRRLLMSDNPKAHIIEIRPSDSNVLLQKVVQVRSIVEEELGFVASVEDEKKRPCTAFLCIIQKRVVGLALIEAIETAYVLQSSSSPLRSSNLQERSPVGMDGISNSRPNEARKVEVETTDRRGDDHWERSIEARPAILGIYQLWVHQQHRKCGIATALLDTVRAHAVFGCHNLPLNRLAFSSPTEAGIRFALQYCSEHSHRPKTHSTTPICVAEAEVLVYDCC